MTNGHAKQADREFFFSFFLFFGEFASISYLFIARAETNDPICCPCCLRRRLPVNGVLIRQFSLEK